MSHLVSIELEIKDLGALREAGKVWGAQLLPGRHDWYRVSVGDYPLPEGFTRSMLGNSDYKLHFPGINYEVGIYKHPTKAGCYVALFDYFGREGTRHDGDKLAALLGGNEAPRLKQEYAVAKATLEARRRGLQVQRTNQANGSVKLVVMGATL